MECDKKLSNLQPKQIHSLKLTFLPLKIGVSDRTLLFQGFAYFQGRTVGFREGVRRDFFGGCCDWTWGEKRYNGINTHRPVV